MVTQDWKNSLGSLLSLTIDYIVNNLALYGNGNLEQLRSLPSHLKNRILKKFTTSSYFWQNVDFKNILSAVVNDNTKHVNLTSATVDDEMLNILSNCKNITKLYLTRTKHNFITNAGLMNLLKQTSHLYLLMITQCDEVNDDVLECLSKYCQNLRGLDIGGCKNVTDTGIKHLSTLKNLTWLTFSQTQISDDGICSLVKENGAKIRELRVDNCSNVTDVGLKAIAEHCPNIEVLMFYNCSTHRDHTISTFEEGNFKNLKQLTWTITW